MVDSIWYVVHGIWYVVSGALILYMVSTPKYLVHGIIWHILYMVPGIWEFPEIRGPHVVDSI